MSIWNKIKQFITYQGDIIKLEREVHRLSKIINRFYYYLSDIPTECDKCIGYDEYSDIEVTNFCAKCNDTGMIKHSQLFDWPQ